MRTKAGHKMLMMLLTALCFLLTLASSAHAECAWVLWETSPGSQAELKAIAASTT